MRFAYCFGAQSWKRSPASTCLRATSVGEYSRALESPFFLILRRSPPRPLFSAGTLETWSFQLFTEQTVGCQPLTAGFTAGASAGCCEATTISGSAVNKRYRCVSKRAPSRNLRGVAPRC